MSGYTVTYQMRKKKRQRRDKIAAYVLTFVAVIFAAFIIVRFLCAGYTVQGDSMLPTYESGEKRLVNRLIYKVKSPARYDIILFESEDETNKQYYVKRVVGLPGETVQVRGRERLCRRQEGQKLRKRTDPVSRTGSRRRKTIQESIFCHGRQLQ